MHNEADGMLFDSVVSAVFLVGCLFVVLRWEILDLIINSVWIKLG